MTWSALSPEAMRAVRNANFRHMLDGIRVRRLARGPRLEGHLVIIPAEVGFFHKEANAEWKRLGFRWNEKRYYWWRDTRRPHPDNNRRYSARTWLKATRKLFFGFWSHLEKYREDQA